MDGSVIVAIISGLFTLIGTIVTVWLGNSKTQYRLQKLEEKQDKHNTLIERMYKVEGQVTELQHDIKELKKIKYED